MITINLTQLIKFLDEQYPALLLDLQEQNQLQQWTARMLETHSQAGDEAEFFLLLSQSLGPSKFLYIKEILEEDFPQSFQQLSMIGVLKYEILNISNRCEDVLEQLSINEESRMLRLAVMGVISDYLYQSSIG